MILASSLAPSSGYCLVLAIPRGPITGHSTGQIDSIIVKLRKVRCLLAISLPLSLVIEISDATHPVYKQQCKADMWIRI